MHKTRDEFWKVMLGRPIILLGSAKNIKKFSAKKGDEFFIPKNTAHQALAPKGKVLLMAISYGRFNPRDKVRIDDKYGRHRESLS
jgi:mannose-6-phosphate isomerase